VGAVVTGLALPEDPFSYLLGAVSVLLAITVAFLADMLVNLAAFWLVETRGLTIVYTAVMNLLSGFLIPILWFPDWLLAIARATPFPSMIQTPIDTLSGRLSPAEALPLVGVQIGWVLVLALAAQPFLRAGRRSVSFQGGRSLPPRPPSRPRGSSGLHRALGRDPLLVSDPIAGLVPRQLPRRCHGAGADREHAFPRAVGDI